MRNYDHNSRFLLVKKYGGPAGHEARLPGEPQKNQQREDHEHTALSERHLAQLFVFIFHNLVCFAVAIFVRATPKGLFHA